LPRAQSAELHPCQSGGPITELHKRGLLGPDLLVIHGNLISNDELELMAAAGMSICFTPSADVQGTPADIVRRAADKGVRLVFGCDIPSHVASDPIGQLRIMFNIQGFLDGAMARAFNIVSGRRPPVRKDMPLLRPRDLLRIATIETARAYGLDDKIGSLVPGKRADILLVRKGQFGYSVTDDPCAHVLLQTSPREIDTVIVDGTPRMRAGALLGSILPRPQDGSRVAAANSGAVETGRRSMSGTFLLFMRP